jgi:hypothetical protein
MNTPLAEAWLYRSLFNFILNYLLIGVLYDFPVAGL